MSAGDRKTDQETEAGPSWSPSLLKHLRERGQRARPKRQNYITSFTRIGEGHTGTNLNAATQRRRIVLALLVLATLVVVGVVVVELSSPCGALACGTVPEPAIRGANAQVDSFLPSACQTTLDVATCRVYLGGGDNGTVSLNVSIRGRSQGQSHQVEFLVYSSAASYVGFTSIPSCAHTSAPSYEDQGCQISGAAVETFHFSFVVSKDYGDATPRWPDSISVVMWAT